MEWLKENSVSLLWTCLWLVCLFLYLPLVSDAGYLPKLAGFSVLIFFGLLMNWSSFSFSINSALLLLALIFLSVIPSLIISDNPGDGILLLVRCALAFLLVAVFSLNQQPDQLKRFAVKIYTLSLLVLSIWGLGELVMSLNGFVLTHKATYSVSATLGHRNLYVQYLVLLAPISSVGLRDKGHSRLLSLTALLTSILVVVLLLNRTAWFTFGAYVIIVFASFFTMKRKVFYKRRNLLGTISVFAIISIVAALFLVDEIYTFVHHFETVFDFSKGTSRDRILLAQRSFELFKEHPFFGIGAGMWKIDIMGFTQEGMLTNSANIFYQRPHNDYLWILSESGLVAGIAFIALHVIGFFNAVRSWFLDKTLMSLAIVLSWVGFIIASLTSFPIERPEYILFFAMLLVLTFKNYSVLDTRVWRSVLFVFNAVVLLVLVIRIAGESDYLKAKTAQTNQSWHESQELMSTAKSSLFQVDALSIPLAHHEALAQFQLGQIDAASTGFQDALQINPYHPETWNSLGICAVAKNDLDSGLICFNNAVRYTSSYQDAWLNIAIIQYNQGQWRTSFRSFLKADSAQSTENYEQLGTLLSIDSLSRMLPMIPDHKMMKTLEALRNTPEWAFSVIQKCASNDVPFDRQAYLDACFFMLKHCEEYEDCDLVDEIIEQYLPGGKAELNLTEE